MATAKCNNCGKEYQLLTSEGLCWLCSSKKSVKIYAEKKALEKAKEPFEEKRAWKRFIIQMHLQVCYGQSAESAVVLPGATLNLSMGGMCIEWYPCEQCTGYEPGGIHPDCILSRYDKNSENSEIMYVSLFVSELDAVTLATKVVFTMKKDDMEFIGVCFWDIDENTKERIRNIIEEVLSNGQAEPPAEV